MTVKFFEALENRTGGSDKVYVVIVVEDGPSVFTVTGYNGRRGSTLTQQGKGSFASMALAMVKANEVLKDKKKTYSPYSGRIPAGLPGLVHTRIETYLAGGTPAAGPVVPAAPSSGVKAKKGPEPMLAKPLNEDFLDESLNGAWAAQRKYDGERVIVSLQRSTGAVGYNRTRSERPLPVEVMKVFSDFLASSDCDDDQETILDGEVFGDSLVLFDALMLKGHDVQHLPFIERYYSLEDLFERRIGVGPKALSLAPVAWEPAEKEALLAQANSEKWEGLIFRDTSAPYQGGRADTLLKHKLWASATCRVLHTNSQRSVGLGLIDESGNDVPVGNVTIPANHDIPEPYALVEIRYLYAHEGGSLYQPVYLGERKDKEEADLRNSLKTPPPEKLAA